MTETWGSLQERFGETASVEAAYGETTVTVTPELWISALEQARDLGYAFFDWLTAVDEEADGFTVVAHVAVIEGEDKADRLLIRTRVPRDKAELPTATTVFRGANWHERETHEMFGIAFTGHPNLVPLLLPDGFDGHPLRKDFVLAARVAKEWPGVKEPGEGGPGHGAGKPTATRRRMVPPGVPDGWLKPLPEESSEVTEAVPESDSGADSEAASEAVSEKTAAQAPEATPTEGDEA